MANNIAPRDPNFEAVIQGVSSLDFISTTNIAVNPSTHAMLVEGTFSPSGTQDVNVTKVGGVAFSLGQQLAAASLPVVLTAAQIATLTPLATVAVTQSTSPWVVSLASTTITGTVAVTQSGTWSTRTQDGSGNAITSTGNALDVNLKTSSITVNTKLTPSTTCTTTSVNDQATSVTLLASNANRLGASIVNDSTSTLYIKCGATASITSYDAILFQYELWECPFGYTGIIDGIWSVNSSGAARIGEFT